MEPQVQIREPEFVEIKAVDVDNPIRVLPQLRLGSLLMEYHRAVVDYYDHVWRHGDCRQIDVFHDDGSGTDQQRGMRVDAPMQAALWGRLSMFNGEILRRVYAGKDCAIRLLEQMSKYVEGQVASDATIPPTDAEVIRERQAAEVYPIPGSAEKLRRDGSEA